MFPKYYDHNVMSLHYNILVDAKEIAKSIQSDSLLSYAYGWAGERDFISINQYVKNIPSLFLTFSAEVVFLSGLFKLLNTCNNPLRSNVV